MVTRRTLQESPLIYWARERESLRKRKAAGIIPWTDDPYLSKYRFCNLRRRDDRVSQWLIKHVFARQKEFSPWSFLQFTALCRWVNWPPTFIGMQQQGLWPSKELKFDAITKYIDDCSDKAWTGAYMVRAAPKRDYGVMSKAAFVCNIVVDEGMSSVKKELLGALRQHQIRPVWEILYSIKNWGSFMAGQVVADWSYTPLLDHAGDICAWAPVGPGSRRGYNRLLTLPLNTAAPPVDVWCAQLQQWRRDLIAALGPEYVSLTLMDVQNALCETDKYLRVKSGEGRPRSTYTPETAYV